MTSNQFNRSHNAVPLPLQASKNKTTSASEPFSARPKTGRSQLGGDFQPSEYSVICGKGKASFNHVGNRRFRILTSSFLESYSRAISKKPRSVILSEIVAMNRQAGGNFCRYEEGSWFEVGDSCARKKVSNVFRDLMQTQQQCSIKVAKKQNLARRRARTLNKKQNQQSVQGTGHSDDSSAASSPSCWGSNTDSLVGPYLLDDDSSTVSSSSSRWGTAMNSLGGQYLPDDDVFFDIECVFK
jgi:hypothetical protein